MICDCCGGKGKILDTVSRSFVPCPCCNTVIDEAKNSVVDGIVTEMVADDGLSSNGHRFDFGGMFDDLSGKEQSELTDGERRLLNVREQMEMTKPMLKRLRIPEDYFHRKYEKDLVFTKDVYDSFDRNSVENVAMLCQSVLDRVYAGFLPLQSVYIQMPNSSKSCLWVYTLQRIAVMRGISTAPYIDLTELLRLRDPDYRWRGRKSVSSDSDELSRNYDILGLDISDINEPTFNDYYEVGLCVIEVPSYVRFDEWLVLSDLLRARARRGLATVAVGTLNDTVLSNRKGSGARYLFSSRLDTNSLSMLKPYSMRGIHSREPLVNESEPTEVVGKTEDYSELI